ncbi:hypothetical protein K440DRAFT_682589 [Wilcoxina mikolae CBS 423.85]|nr:hypothetical protein K440DRAFT_682589 [Wilcoxina mikolae CBS 423.85]
MLFKPLITVLFMVTTLVGAVPQVVSERKLLGSVAMKHSSSQTEAKNIVTNAFSKALKLGINPAGTRPTDYIKDNGRYITFRSGSKFAAWVNAQSGRKEKAALERRYDSNSDLDVVYNLTSPQSWRNCMWSVS